MRERELSYWGWGWADKFPDVEARKALGAQVQAMLGFPPQDVIEPLPIEALELPVPRCQPPPSFNGFARVDRRSRASHTYGKSFPDLVRGIGGTFERPPDFVAFPSDEQQLADVLDWCGDAGVAVVPFGGGSSVVGGVEAPREDRFTGVASLDLRALNRVVEVDDVSLAARIQAGALGPELNAQLAEHSLELRHFPQSYEFSTLGGWLATRAGGHYATVYTHIDDLTESIRMITPRGPWESARLPGSGAGPSPDRWVLGSEGTLGVITEAWMRVVKKPRFRAGASVLFDDWDAAVRATRALGQSPLHPTNCRLLDHREAMLNGVALTGASVLLLGFESADQPLEPFMEAALKIALEGGGRCPDGPTYRDSAGASKDAAGTWRTAFMEAPYLRNTLVSLGLIVDTFETACTWDRFEALHAAIITGVRAAMKEACGKGFISCRFTHVYPDGPAPYYTFIAPAKSGGTLEQWRAIKKAAGDILAEHGATITHHHAVGRMHRPWYDRQRPDRFADALRAAKHTLDPKGILNPGVLID